MSPRRPAPLDRRRARGARGARRERAVEPALVLASSFHVSGYAREEGTPSWVALEAAVGALEGGEAVAFASGMGAIAAVLEELPPGARIVVPGTTATPARARCSARARRRARWCRAGRHRRHRRDARRVRRRGLLWVETPSNPMIAIAELDALCAGAHAAGALVAVDSTLATPLLQRPLELGAEHRRPQRHEVHRRPLRPAAGHRGHARPRAGRAPARGPAAARHHARRARVLTSPSAACGRCRCGSSAARPAPRCSRSAWPPTRRSARVRYPGLPGDPGHERAARLMDGFGAVLSFEVTGGAGPGGPRLRARSRVHAREEPRRGGEPDRAPPPAPPGPARRRRFCG